MDKPSGFFRTTLFFTRDSTDIYFTFTEEETIRDVGAFSFLLRENHLHRSFFPLSSLRSRHSNKPPLRKGISAKTVSAVSGFLNKVSYRYRLFYTIGITVFKKSFVFCKNTVFFSPRIHALIEGSKEKIL